MGNGGEAEITSIQASPEHNAPHNYIFLRGNAEHRSWARSSARIERRAFNDSGGGPEKPGGRNPDVPGSNPGGPESTPINLNYARYEVYVKNWDIKGVEVGRGFVVVLSIRDIFSLALLMLPAS